MWWTKDNVKLLPVEVVSFNFSCSKSLNEIRSIILSIIFKFFFPISFNFARPIAQNSGYFIIIPSAPKYGLMRLLTRREVMIKMIGT